MEYNTDLALRNIKDYKSGACKKEECVPEPLEVGKEYEFLKKGHRNYENFGEVTLLEMKPDDVLFDMRAQVIVKDPGFTVVDGQSYTLGRYEVREILTG